MELEKLKSLLGIEDDTKDHILEFIMADVEETIKNYCNIEEVPDGLVNTAYRMAADIYRNEQMGSEDVPQSVSSVTVGDTSTSFKTSSTEFSESIMKNYKAALNRYRKVEF